MKKEPLWKKLFDVFPGIISKNIIYSALIYFKGFREIYYRNFRIRLPNKFYIFISQFGASLAFATSHASISVGMFHVFLMRNIFKIRNMIVHSVAIFMVHFKTFRTFTYKFLHYQSVSSKPFMLSISVKHNRKDIMPSLPRFKNTNIRSLPGYTSFNSPIIAYGIFGIICNRFPLFSCIHSTIMA